MSNALVRAEAALERLALLHPKLIDLGLDRGLGLLAKLGHPQHQLPPVFHAAGTNGKGSTLAFIRAMIEASGQTIHGYSSPHLVRFHERIRISSQLISDDHLADLLEEVETTNGNDPMTFFEITTAAAMLAFSRIPAAATLLETGLGGRADSTNVIAEPAVNIITPIARDHEHFLGDTISAIAGEKAGIMRRDVPCFSAVQEPDAHQTLREYADALGTPLYMAGEDFTITPEGDGVVIALGSRKLHLPKLGLRGIHQAENAGLAAAAVMTVFPDLDDDILTTGAAAAEWPGRIQNLSHGQLIEGQDDHISVWLDGAHNAHGAMALAKTLPQLADGPWVLICGALNTRDPRDFLMPLKDHVHHAICLTIPDQEASLPNHVIAEAARDIGLDADTSTDIKTAMEHAYTLAERKGGAEKKPGNIIIAGSLYLAGHVLTVNQTLPD